MPGLLTVTQAAGRLGLTRRAVLFAIERKRLKATRYGVAWLIRPADLDAYATSRIHDEKPGRKSASKPLDIVPD